MTQVSRKGFVDKNGQKVVIVPKVPGATSGNIASFDEEGNLQDSGIPAELVGREIHALEFEDGSYESRMGVGKLNRDDDELDGASVYGKDAIRIGVNGVSVYIDDNNIDNLKCSLLGLEITFIRDENGDYVIDSNLKQQLNELLTLIPLKNCVPCAVQAQWWDEDHQTTSSAEYPGALCITRIIGPRIYTTVYLSFAGNYYYVTRSNVNDFPNTWTKFENPFVIDPAFNVAPVKSTDTTPTYDDASLITSGAVKASIESAIADLAYAEILNLRALQLGGIYLVKGTTLADYTIENISTSAMQSYISAIVEEVGIGRIDHLVIGLKDGATTYELLSTVHVEGSGSIALYIGDVVVSIGRNNQSPWELGSVTKISSLF